VGGWFGFGWWVRVGSWKKWRLRTEVAVTNSIKLLTKEITETSRQNLSKPRRERTLDLGIS
jgi:hypothetical protein